MYITIVWHFCFSLVSQFEPVFGAGSERHVHHMFVSECTSDQPAVRAALEELANTEGDQCNSPNMVHLLKACTQVVVAWATGSKVSTIVV